MASCPAKLVMQADMHMVAAAEPGAEHPPTHPLLGRRRCVLIVGGLLYARASHTVDHFTVALALCPVRSVGRRTAAASLPSFYCAAPDCWRRCGGTQCKSCESTWRVVRELSLPRCSWMARGETEIMCWPYQTMIAIKCH